MHGDQRDRIPLNEFDGAEKSEEMGDREEGGESVLKLSNINQT